MNTTPTPNRHNIPNMTTNQPLIPPDIRWPELEVVDGEIHTLSELIERDYHSLKAACAALAWAVDTGASFFSMSAIKKEKVLERIYDITRRDDIKEMLNNQVAPDGSRRQR